MSEIKKILADTNHRTWDLPKENWVYYQEWNRVLFLHWAVEPKLFAGLLPTGIELDLYEGKAWISLVPFTMEKIRPSFLPPFAPISNFHEINLRTYVTKNGKSGVYFINIGSQKLLSTLLTKKLSGLPYEKAHMARQIDGPKQQYVSCNSVRDLRFSARFTISPRTTPKSTLELWLTERYCLYVDQGTNLYCYDIHHREWDLENVTLEQFAIDYKIGQLNLVDKPDHINYSKGIQVVAWPKEKV